MSDPCAAEYETCVFLRRQHVRLLETMDCTSCHPKKHVSHIEVKDGQTFCWKNGFRVQFASSCSAMSTLQLFYQKTPIVSFWAIMSTFYSNSNCDESLPTSLPTHQHTCVVGLPAGSTSSRLCIHSPSKGHRQSCTAAAAGSGWPGRVLPGYTA